MVADCTTFFTGHLMGDYPAEVLVQGSMSKERAGTFWPHRASIQTEKSTAGKSCHVLFKYLFVRDQSGCWILFVNERDPGRRDDQLSSGNIFLVRSSRVNAMSAFSRSPATCSVAYQR